MKRVLPLLILAFACSCLTAFGEDKAKESQSIAELQTAIEKVLTETKTPGMAIAIVSKDKVEWVAGLGKADVEANRAVTPRTLFRIGSVSKSFAALAALKLQEDGKLKLTDTLRDRAPEIAFENPWEATDPIRLVHLMEHSSGIPDMRLCEYANNDPRPIALAEALRMHPEFRVTRWRPGSRGAYSNTGPTLLAYVIEKVTGQRFEDYVRESIFAPLGIDTASYLLTPEVEQNLTKLYEPDGKTVIRYWHILYRPAGAINASAENMANVLRFYLQRGSLDGRRVLKPASIDRMETPGTLPAAQLGATIGYGLYNYASFENGYEFHGHNGGMTGALAEMAYSTQLGRGYAFMINTSNGKAFWRVSQLVRKYLVRELKSPELPKAITLSPEVQNRYSGYYMSITPRSRGPMGHMERFSSVKNIKADEKGLSFLPVLSGWPERWLPLSPALFRREKESKPAMVFFTDKNGQLLLQNEVGTAQKTSAINYWLIVVGIAFSLLMLLSSVVFAFVWGTRKCLGRLRSPGPLLVRMLPLVGSVVVATFLVLIQMMGAKQDLSVLGTMNAQTISVFVLSIMIPVGAFLSVIAVWRHRNAPMNRIAYWHSFAVTLGLVFITGLGSYVGMIGWRFWV